MSLQRIIELARRQGIPMIITDVAGREPMVVLPLEVYEGMLNQEESGQAGLGQSIKIKDQRVEGGEEYPVSGSRPSPSDPVPPIPSNPPPFVPSRPTPPPVRPPQQDGLRVRQRDEDRTQALHRSLDTVSQAVPSLQPASSSLPPDFVMEERFSFQS